MRKKSHILVAKYLAANVGDIELIDHKKAFCLGSILPDMKPSFLTTKHEFDGTFDMVQEQIRKLTIDCNPETRNERVYCRRLGEVSHYIADYFTFPHNSTYEGSLLEHGQYEKDLKNDLKAYIKTPESVVHAETDVVFHSMDDLFSFIDTAHMRYMSRKRNVADDIQYILTVCYQVVQGIVQLLNERIIDIKRAKTRLAVV